MNLLYMTTKTRLVGVIKRVNTLMQEKTLFLEAPQQWLSVRRLVEWTFFCIYNIGRSSWNSFCRHELGLPQEYRTNYGNGASRFQGICGVFASLTFRISLGSLTKSNILLQMLFGCTMWYVAVRFDLFGLAKSYNDDVHGRSYDVEFESKEVHAF